MSQSIDSTSSGAGVARATDGLLAAIQRKPLIAFTVFEIGHAVLWTVIPTILHRSLPLDVIEGVAHGRDWQLGYWKHPPLPWLLLDITHQIFGGRILFFFLLGQLSAVVAAWAIWRLAREILTPLEAFVAVVLLDGYIDFNINPGVFNHNVLQLPMFALAGWSLYRAFVRGALLDWLLVGLWFALAFYTKYEAIVLLAPALLFSVVDHQARRCWRTPGPYIASVVFAGLFAPQFIWMAFVDHFSAIQFAINKAKPMHSLLDLLWANAVITTVALFYVVPVAVLFFWMTKRMSPTMPSSPVSSNRFAQRYLAFMAFGPLVTAVGIGLLRNLQLDQGWVEQFWCFSSLYLMTAWRPALDQALLHRLLIGWCGLTGSLVAVSIAAGVFLVAHGYLFETQFPGERFSALVTRAWHNEVGKAPLPYVVGEFWSAGNIILFSPERPRLFEEGDRTHSPLVDPNDIRRRGAVILFEPQVGLNKLPAAQKSAPWLAEFPGAESRRPFVIRQETLRGEIDWVIGWALLKPEAGIASSTR